jgi:hypothetical protein
MFKNNKFLIPTLIILISLLILLPQISLASDNQKQGGNIYIGPDEVINNNFMAFGATVNIKGTVNGDVIVGGGNVEISGPVAGDVIAFGGDVKVKGPVAGNVRVAGGTIDIESKIGKNATLFGGNLIISENSEIGWNLTFGAGNADIKGKINGYLDGGGANISIGAEVGRDANLKVDSEGSLVLLPGAQIKGDLKYTAAGQSQLNKDEGAKVEGKTIFTEFEKSVQEKGKSWPGYLFWKLICLFGLLVVGLVLVSLGRDKLGKVTSQMSQKPWASLGWGIIYFIITPVLLVLLAATIIGIPLALIGGALYLICLYISQVFAGITIGQILLSWPTKSKKKKIRPPLIWSMILGVVLLLILTSIPLVGWIIKILAIWWGLGAILEVKRQVFKS